jgi:thiol-disulfide isomerase/thioredoxin
MKIANYRTWIRLGALLALSLPALLAARVWTNDRGYRLEAELGRIMESEVFLIDENGRGHRYSIARLSQADQEFIEKERARRARAEAEATKPELDFEWLDDYEEAIDLAKDHDVPVFVLITGSDWCGYCIKLKREVLDQDVFEEAAEGKLVLFEADFPRKKKLSGKLREQNEAVKKKFNARGFPTVVVIDPDNEKVLWRSVGYGGNASGYIQALEAVIRKS